MIKLMCRIFNHRWGLWHLYTKAGDRLMNRACKRCAVEETKPWPKQN